MSPCKHFCGTPGIQSAIITTINFRSLLRPKSLKHISSHASPTPQTDVLPVSMICHSWTFHVNGHIPNLCSFVTGIFHLAQCFQGSATLCLDISRQGSRMLTSRAFRDSEKLSSSISVWNTPLCLLRPANCSSFSIHTSLL